MATGISKKVNVGQHSRHKIIYLCTSKDKPLIYDEQIKFENIS